MMNVTIYDHLPAAPVWQSIFEHCGDGDYFSSRSWYETFLGTVARHEGGVAFVVAQDASGEASAILPLWLRGSSKPWLLRKATSLANYYSCLYQPLLCADRSRAGLGLEAIAAYLSKAGSKWSIVDLLPLPDDAWYLPTLCEAFTCNGYSIKRYPAFANWYMPVADMDFESYFNARSKKMRSTVRSKTNQLQSKYTFDMRIIEDAGEVDNALRIYDDVYARSWKQAEPYPEFIPTFMRSLAAHSQLRMGTLELDGQPAAAQLWFVAAGAAHIFKLAYKPDFSAYSVGTILTMKLVQHVLDVDHVKVIDFLSGDDEYKKQWMSNRRERIGLEMANTRSIAGMLIGARRIAGRVRRRLLSAHT